jgi:RNA polymerase II subunit A small phosphatase-like protein
MKNTLILDLDETLFHSSPLDMDDDEIGLHHDFKVDDYYFVYLRPHLKDFLKTAFKYFNVAVWTAATNDYATEIVKNIFDEKIEFLYSRKQCSGKYNFFTREHCYLKKLSKLKRKGYDLNNLLIVDDVPESASQNYGNYINIEPFYGYQKDIQLKLLKDYIITLADSNNIRSLEKRLWNKKDKK